MTLTEVKTFLKHNAEDQEVKIFLDSISDKRVNQAIDKLMKNKVPEMVEEETKKRIELEKERDFSIEKEKEFSQELENKIKDLGIPKTLGLSMLSGVDSSISEENLNLKFEEIKSVHEEILKTKYISDPPKKGGMDQLTTEQQVLKNLGLH